MRVIIYGKQTENDLQHHLATFIDRLNRLKVEYWIEEAFFKLLNNSSVSDSLKPEKVFGQKKELENQKFDLFFAFGGDGTILSAVCLVGSSGIPIVGVNTGRLGFLSTLQLSALAENLDDLLNQQYNLSPRSLLEVSSENLSFSNPYALNEITLSRKETTSMVSIETHLKSGFVSSYWADGLIIATPTGSTGYSLSCGGPIVSPNTSNIVLTPIAPHNLNARPFIISDNEVLECTIRSRETQCLISLDARIHSFNSGSKFVIKKAPFLINMVQTLDYTYAKTLREKLQWGQDSRT
ncbi:MAG: NAD kinase [Flavobacteriaceae bacterium]|nr:MAG: NAD kinase [Flavobacteriaceae bacterium]